VRLLAILGSLRLRARRLYPSLADDHRDMFVVSRRVGSRREEWAVVRWNGLLGDGWTGQPACYWGDTRNECDPAVTRAVVREVKAEARRARRGEGHWRPAAERRLFPGPSRS
jgi:hypothetical protein